jgi:hypothetical protein
MNLNMKYEMDGTRQNLIRYLTGMIKRADNWEHARITISRAKAEQLLRLLKNESEGL